MVNITNFTVVLLEDPRHPDTFQLTDDTRGEMTHSATCCYGGSAIALLFGS